MAVPPPAIGHVVPLPLPLLRASLPPLTQGLLPPPSPVHHGCPPPRDRIIRLECDNLLCPPRPEFPCAREPDRFDRACDLPLAPSPSPYDGRRVPIYAVEPLGRTSPADAPPPPPARAELMRAYPRVTNSGTLLDVLV